MIKIDARQSLPKINIKMNITPMKTMQEIRLGTACNRANFKVQLYDTSANSHTVGELIELARVVAAVGGKTVWEWPSRCDLWKDKRVVALTSRPGWTCTDVASSAVDLHFEVKGVKLYLRKKWRIMTDDANVAEALSIFPSTTGPMGRSSRSAEAHLLKRPLIILR